MYLTGTDDFATPAVTDCMSVEVKAQHRKKLSCKDSIHYKLKICKILIKEGSYKKDSASCLKDKEVLPFNVKNDDVGHLDE